MTSKHIAVIGLGTFGGTVARTLAGFGTRVLGIDSDEQAVAHLADSLDQVIIADGRDEQALREAGVEDYDAVVVAIGEDLEANILCTMNVKLLGVETIWVKALSSTHHRILNKLGADRVIHPEEEIGQHVAQMLHNPLVRDYLSLGNGFYIVDVQVPAALDGKLLACRQVSDHKVHCLGQMRGSELLEMQADGWLLCEDDKLLMLGRRDDLRRFGEQLK